MEEKIVLKVIDVVEKTFEPGELVSNAVLKTASGKIIDGVFAFTNKRSLDDFINITKDGFSYFAKDNYLTGVRNGVVLTFVAFAAAGLVGYTTAYVVDKIKTKKMKSKSDI